MSISKEIQEKIALLEKYDDAYHNNTELIDDESYDLFKDNLLKQLPPDHDLLSKVGHVPTSSWPKEGHTIFMGSQNKVSTEETIKDWVNNLYKELGVSDGNVEFVIQHKVDGFSLETKYNKGMISKSVTRGNSLVGENILDNAKLFRYLPTVLKIKKDVVTRGEGVITKKDYCSIQKQSGDMYKNERSASCGISRRYDGAYSKYIRYITYDVNASVKTETEKIEVLKKLGFEPVKTYLVHNLKEILEIYNDYKNSKRDKVEYNIDGLVLKLNDLNLQEKMGLKNNKPLGQIALKFSSDQAITTLNEIATQVGRTGKITPIGILEPVDLMGATIKKATLHNFAYIESNFIGIKAEVTIVRRGDIIPQVYEVLTPGTPYKMPTACPSCGGPVNYDGVNLWCYNKNCKEKDIARINYWMEVLDIKGFSDKFIEKLWDMGKLRSISDLYILKPEDFDGMSGIGEKTVKNFFIALKDTSEMYLQKFIVALGIPSCSTSTADILVEQYGDWEGIKKVRPIDLAKIPGFASISSSAVCEGIEEVSEMADEILKIVKIKQKKQGTLTGKSFCVTGSLATMSRKEFQDIVVDNGGIAKNSVASGLTYLVTNDTSSGSSKNTKAQKLGVSIINESQFLGMLGKKIEEIKPKQKEKSDTSGVKLEYEPIF
jgi:DNA ligase (NAD+)